MKGYSATMVIGLVVAVAIAGFILYLFWSKVILPGGRSYSKSYCMQHLTEDCMESMQKGWSPKVFINVSGCEPYVDNKTAFNNCIGSRSRTDVNCMVLCKQFIGGS